MPLGRHTFAEAMSREGLAVTPSMLRRGLAAVLAAGLVVCGAPWGAVRAASAQEQTLYIAFTDAEGDPVTDMTLDEVIVQWDEVLCEIVELEPVNRPARVTLFVDNATASEDALPDMREGMRRFVQALPSDIEVAVATLSGRPQFRVRHTTDRRAVNDAIGAIAPEGSAATFFDALYEEAERVERDRERQYLSVVVMVAVGGAEGSRSTRDGVMERSMDRLYTNGMVVHTLLFASPYGVGSTLGRAQSRWGTDMAAATRGRFEEMAVSTRYRTALPELAADVRRRHRLTSRQYRVTYRPPEDAADQPRVQVGTTRVGIATMPTDNGNIP